MSYGNPWPKGQSGNTATQFKKGQVMNPGGRPKQVLELLKYCRKRTKKALQLCMKLIEDESTGETFTEAKDRVAFLRVRLEAAKFLAMYGMGAPPKYDPKNDAPAQSESPTDGISREKLEAIARMRLSTESDGSGEPN